MKATAASLVPYHLNITSACATTNLLPTALHTMCTPLSIFLDLPLTWYHFPSFFHPSSVPLTSTADNMLLATYRAHMLKLVKHARDFAPYVSNCQTFIDQFCDNSLILNSTTIKHW